MLLVALSVGSKGLLLPRLKAHRALRALAGSVYYCMYRMSTSATWIEFQYSRRIRIT
jgi:hypothetical protein